jgi:hypothetical protein
MGRWYYHYIQFFLSFVLITSSFTFLFLFRGPNHAADFILTRWLRDQANGQKILNEDTKKPFLQFVGIQRRKGDEWAIPGVSLF